MSSLRLSSQPIAQHVIKQTTHTTTKVNQQRQTKINRKILKTHKKLKDGCLYVRPGCGIKMQTGISYQQAARTHFTLPL